MQAVPGHLHGPCACWCNLRTTRAFPGRVLTARPPGRPSEPAQEGPAEHLPAPAPRQPLPRPLRHQVPPAPTGPRAGPGDTAQGRRPRANVHAPHPRLLHTRPQTHEGGGSEQAVCNTLQEADPAGGVDVPSGQRLARALEAALPAPSCGCVPAPGPRPPAPGGLPEAVVGGAGCQGGREAAGALPPGCSLSIRDVSTVHVGREPREPGGASSTRGLPQAELGTGPGGPALHLAHTRSRPSAPGPAHLRFWNILSHISIPAQLRVTPSGRLRRVLSGHLRPPFQDPSPGPERPPHCTRGSPLPCLLQHNIGDRTSPPSP